MAYREAVNELERLLRANGQWRDLVQLYESRISRAMSRPGGTVAVAELRLGLADLFE